jgi:hypothetical protein
VEKNCRRRRQGTCTFEVTNLGFPAVILYNPRVFSSWLAHNNISQPDPTTLSGDWDTPSNANEQDKMDVRKRISDLGDHRRGRAVSRLVKSRNDYILAANTS